MDLGWCSCCCPLQIAIDGGVFPANLEGTNPMMIALGLVLNTWVWMDWVHCQVEVVVSGIINKS